MIKLQRLVVDFKDYQPKNANLMQNTWSVGRDKLGRVLSSLTPWGDDLNDLLYMEGSFFDVWHLLVNSYD